MVQKFKEKFTKRGEMFMNTNDDSVTLQVSVLVILLTFAISLLIIPKAQCEKIAEKLGYACEYSILTGCIFEKPDGKKILYRNLRYSE